MPFLRPRSHGDAIVPFHLRSSFWNAKIDCSHGNGTIAYRFLFLFTRERNRSVSEFFLQSLPFFPVTTTSTHALRETNLIVPFFGPVLTSLPVHTGTERNDCLSFHFSYHLFHRSTFGTERCYFKSSRVNATPERSTFRNGTIWNGTIAFPCERGLNNSVFKVVFILFRLRTRFSVNGRSEGMISYPFDLV